MSDKQTVVNPGTGPVVWSDDGRVLGAGERAAVVFDDTTRAAVDAGRLTVSEESATDTDAPEEGERDGSARRGRKSTQ